MADGLGMLEELLAQQFMNPLMFKGTSGGFPPIGPQAAPQQAAPPMTPTEQQMMSMVQPQPGQQQGPIGPPAPLSIAGPGPQPNAVPSPPIGAPPLTGTERTLMGMPQEAVPLPMPRPAGAPGGALANADDGSNTPAAAMPVSLAVPPPAPEPSFLERLSAGAKGFAPALMGAGAALQGDGGAMTQSILKEQRLTAGGNQTVAALRAKGVPEADIQAAILNPEMMKALINQNYGTGSKERFTSTIIGRDRNGQPIYGSFNTQTGAQTPFGNQGPKPDETAVADGVTGEEFLQTLDTPTRSRVKAIAEGREPYPAVSRAVDAARIREAVRQYDPGFNTADYNSRLKTRQDFTSGKSAQNLSAFNTAIGHLESLYNSIDGLNNSGQKWWNNIANPIAENTNPKFAAKLQEFQTARTAVADELTRAFRGSGGNVHDIKQWEAAINSASSPIALKAAVRQAAELLNSRIAAVGDQYNRGMNLTKDPLDLLSPKNAKAFRHMLEGDKPSADAAPQRAAPAAPAAAAPLPGAYVYDPATKKLVRAQ